MEVSKKISRLIYKDGVHAYLNKEHPCHHFVQWQKKQKRGLKCFQLPEPFSGLRASLGIVFVALNPSFSVKSSAPRIWSRTKVTPFKDYDKFYRNRFENRNDKGQLISNGKKVILWHRIEQFGREFIQQEFKLGEHAILIDIVQYKSEKGWLGDTTKQKESTLEHCCKLAGEILKDIRPKVIVPLGRKAIKGLSEIFKIDIPKKVGIAMGNIYYDKDKEFAICPIQHLSRPPAKDKSKTVGGNIQQGLETLS